VAVFGPDLTMLPPTEELLDELAHDREFRETFTRFAWSRQYVMRNASLLRDREDPDR
jgi:negative regulator of sigma E activity